MRLGLNLLFAVNLLFVSVGCLQIQPPADPHCHHASNSEFTAKIQTTRMLYPSFILDAFRRPALADIQDLQICVITIEEMNNPVRFDHAQEKIVGRYVSATKRIYITPAGLAPHNTDLPHELVHHFNGENGFTDEKVDEAIAYEFERRYEDAF